MRRWRLTHGRRDKVKVISLVEKMSGASTFNRLLTKTARSKKTGLGFTKTPLRGNKMTPESKIDFRIPTASKWSVPRAVADGAGGTINATAGVIAPPERVFRALTTNEVERWWGNPDYYRQTGWKADLRVCGQWSVTVVFTDGNTNGGSGEFAEIDAPRKLVMTRNSRSIRCRARARRPSPTVSTPSRPAPAYRCAMKGSSAGVRLRLEMPNIGNAFSAGLQHISTKTQKETTDEKKERSWQRCFLEIICRS